MTENKAPGKIITFYSYKGGSGRSMALANVAWVLASNGKRVLAIDWDLEAPGLHRYFAPFLADRELTSSEGLINFVDDYRVRAMSPPPGGQAAPDWYLAYADISHYAVAVDWPFDGGGRIDLVPAGRQDDSYSQLFNLFNWHDFYTLLGGGKFLDAVKELMRRDYDYVLIDSRTGASDTSGICTIKMPDTLVICFTLNNQSILGAARVADSVSRQRTLAGRAAAAGGDLEVYPVPTRIDSGEQEKLSLRTRLAKEKFDRFPNTLPEGPEREQYWADIPFPHVTYYAYEEVLAAFGPATGTYASMLACSVRLTSVLTHGEVARAVAPPEARRQDVLKLYEGKLPPAASAQAVAEAERTLARMSPEQQERAEQLLLSLVYVVPSDGSGGGEVKPLSVALKSIPEPSQAVARQFAEAGVLKLEREKSGDGTTVTLPDEMLPRWPWLARLVEENRGFLVWRPKVRASFANWESNKKDSAELLRGRTLKEAREYVLTHAGHLGAAEAEYIGESIRRADKGQRLRNRLLLVAALAGVVVAAAAVAGVRQTLRERAARAEAASKVAASAAALSPEADAQLRVLLAAEALKLASSPAAEEVLRSDLPLLPVPFNVLAHDGNVYQATFAPDGSLTTLSGRLVNPNLPNQSGRLYPPESGMSLLDGNVRAWDVIAGTETARVEVKASPEHLLLSPDGRYVAFVTLREPGPPAVYEKRVLEVRTGATVLSASLTGRLLETAFSADGNYFAVAHGGLVSVWRLKAEGGAQLLAPLRHGADVYALAFSRDSRYLAAGSDDDLVQVWDVQTGLKAGESIKLEETAYAFAFGDPDVWGRPTLLTLTENGRRITIWDWAAGVPLVVLNYDGVVNSFALSPDNAFIAASTEKGLVLSRTGDLQGPVHEPLDSSLSLDPVFSPDGKLVAGVGDENALKLWEVPMPRRVFRVFGAGVFNDAAFSRAGGGLFATAGDDSAVRLWRLAPELSEDLLREACVRLTRNLTRQEWQKYLTGEYQRTCPDLP